MVRNRQPMQDQPAEMATPQLRNKLKHAQSLLAGAERPVHFSGAGLSAESGVSTFRDPATGGQWQKHDPMALASPQGFAADAELVMDWYGHRRRQIAAAEPNHAHCALAGHATMSHITQNVDNLLQRAGASNVLQLHGSITADRCHNNCGYVAGVDMHDPPGVRKCPECGSSRLRPSVVWFGEGLPQDVWQRAEQLCQQCDVLLVVGTSAVVYPAAGLINIAHDAGAAIILVNTQPSEASHVADCELLGPAGEIVPAVLGC